MKSIENEVMKSIKMMLKETQQSSYFEKYQRWMEIIQKVQSEQKSQVLAMFLDYFPFNYKQWLQYIELNGPEKFQVALKRNPKSYELWMKYLEYIRSSGISNQPQKYKKEIQRAILDVGADSRTGSIYIEYYNLLSENYRYEYFKKIFTRALTNLQEIYALFQQWFNSKSQSQLTYIAAKQTKGRFTVPTAELKSFLTKEINQTYEKTLRYRKNRLQLQARIQVWYFNGQQEKIKQDYQVWRELIHLDRSSSTVQNTSYCYQRMLMAQMHNLELWEEVFHYLQNETNKYMKVLNIFRYNKQFFLKFDTSLYFYWCDLQERENANEARKMYLELSSHNSRPEVILRHIQLEIREKQWENARKLFDSLIAQNQQNIQLLCYILVQYSNYVTKYYKDYQYPKKLYQSYFEYLPYNGYLFSNYLNFLRNFEYKEGYYDQLMALIIQGLKKAKKVLNDEDFEKKVVKMVKHHLRTVLSSIYLIKLSERKMMEFDRN